MSIKKIFSSRASLNAGASYLGFISTSLWGLVSIPLAVAYLSKEEIGLWAVVNAVIGYLVWMDMGVGPAVGRLIAPSVASRDQIEMNRWWSLTKAALWCQGILVILIGVALGPVLPRLLGVPLHFQSEAAFLLVGGAALTGLGIPMRGAAGLLMAQNRFHWVPLLHAIVPWINLVTFFVLLRMGFGLRAYLGALVASQSATWLAFRLILWLGPDRLKWDSSGLTMTRFRQMFGLSGSMAIIGIVESFLQTLPNMLLARLAGLASVPLYNFSAKGPVLGGHLVIRTYHAFYPSLQCLYLAGKKDLFRRRHCEVGMITISFAMVGSAIVLLINPFIVQLLAGSEFYAGSQVNIWFAVAIITVPMAGLFQLLLPISGIMGKSATIACGKLFLGTGAAVILWKGFGMAGLAAVFAFLPLVDGTYGYFRGARNCGYARHELSVGVAVFGLAVIVLTILVGGFVASAELGTSVVSCYGHEFHVPSFKQLLPPAMQALVGVACFVFFLRRLLTAKLSPLPS